MRKPAILFFCLGNICRSPVAEGIFLSLLKDSGLEHAVEVDSAATSRYEIGNPPDRRSAKVAKQFGIVLSHAARQLAPQDLIDFDWIVGMEQNNLDNAFGLLGPSEEERKKFFLLRNWDPEGEGPVPDPYYGSLDNFEFVHQLIARCMPHLLEDFKIKFKL